MYIYKYKFILHKNIFDNVISKELVAIVSNNDIGSDLITTEPFFV